MNIIILVEISLVDLFLQNTMNSLRLDWKATAKPLGLFPPFLIIGV